jgi:hypothetical protein
MIDLTVLPPSPGVSVMEEGTPCSVSAEIYIGHDNPNNSLQVEHGASPTPSPHAPSPSPPAPSLTDIPTLDLEATIGAESPEPFPYPTDFDPNNNSFFSRMAEAEKSAAGGESDSPVSPVVDGSALTQSDDALGDDGDQPAVELRVTKMLIVASPRA